MNITSNILPITSNIQQITSNILPITSNMIYSSNFYIPPITSNIQQITLQEEPIHHCKMCINHFNNNFTTTINTLSTPHVDSTGTYPGAVGFNIICNSNLRKNYFQYHPTEDIIKNNSYNVIVDIAWSNLSMNINDWATTILSSNALIGNVYIPEDEFINNNINLEIFNKNYIVNITNLYVYPINSPNCWLVNFNIKNINNNEFININSQVLIPTFTSLKDDTIIVNEAWNNIKNQVGEWAYNKLTVSNLINTIYIPSAL